MLRALVTLVAFSLISFTSPGTGNVAPEIATVTEVKEVSGGSMPFTKKQAAFEEHIQEVYTSLGLKETGLSSDVFRKAYIGFQNLKQQGLASSTKDILTVVDFTQSSNKKRLWTIDLGANKVLMNTFVSHGRNTGNAKALKFSNTPNSYMSSLGFYVTDKTYYGKHGLSLRMSGMDEGFNSNAMSRAIVVHGAEYATEKFIKQYGRLGRSLGCPAVPKEDSKQLIETIKDETVLYIHGADKEYTSSYLDEKAVVENFALQLPADSGLTASM